MGRGEGVSAEGLEADGHIHSFSSIFPGVQLDTMGDSECHTAPYCATFTVASGVGGCPQDP